MEEKKESLVRETIHKRLLAVEMLASRPHLKVDDISKLLGVSKPTVYNWLSKPDFADKVYKRYMEIAGLELPIVVSAMIREASKGNVQAGRLVLEHFGKLDNRIKIQVESPFEKFMKIDNDEIEEAEFSDDEEVIETSKEIADKAAELLEQVPPLPERDEANDKPKIRKIKENYSLEQAIESGSADEIRKAKDRAYYKRRKRARAVGLELLEPGNHIKSVRDDWWKKLEKLEIARFGEIQGYRT